MLMMLEIKREGGVVTYTAVSLLQAAVASIEAVLNVHTHPIIISTTIQELKAYA
jgi:hypothetical protein